MAFIPSSPTILTSSLSHICASPNATTQRSTRTLSTSQTSNTSSRCRSTITMMSPNRKFLVGGNWKCNLTKSSIAELVKALNDGPPLDPSSIEVVVSPPTVYLESTTSSLRNDYETCAQNSWISSGGAFTGETDAKMISDVGAKWVLLGHSERRHLPQLKEKDLDIAIKAKYALAETDLKVIFCIGELLDEREAGNTFNVCQRQLKALADTIDDWSKVVIAYEPVWAIGTGKVATPDQAEEVHLSVRNWLSKNVSQEVADSTRILYGGSVSPANCEELAKKPNVDGFLVGGASLKPSFLEIVDSYKAAKAALAEAV